MKTHHTDPVATAAKSGVNEDSERPPARMNRLITAQLRATLPIVLAIFCLLCRSGIAFAHPLGNFTINHFARIEVGGEKIHLRYVIDMAEIPTLQELQRIVGDIEAQPSKSQLDAYAAREAADYGNGLLLIVDGERYPLQVLSRDAKLLPGAGGLQTFRIECDFATEIPMTGSVAVRRLRFEDKNFQDRIGWREISVSPLAGSIIFDSTAFGSSITDELKAYPADRLAAPLDERQAELSFSRGSVPTGARALIARDGHVVTPSRDRLAELIAVPELTAGVALAGLLVAMLLGGLHAMSPGHGKAVVGAYLVGSRGTARHAVFLGLTVTITHTAGVFALGIVTLLASEYVVPERLFPILSFGSGAIVVAIGSSLLLRRLRTALSRQPVHYTHVHDGQEHEHLSQSEDHTHATGQIHSHGGRPHSHLPPGADGTPVNWRNLLALGISGGLLPCPSALVVLLAAISLHRVGYGLLLVLAFSFGLAGVLTGVGLAFVYAGRLLKSTGKFDTIARVLPALSAFVITCAGLAICYEALNQTELITQIAIRWRALTAGTGPSFVSVGAAGLLGLGLVYGLKHATEVDHIVAVSAIVSEHKKLARAAIVGGLWGAGHTASLVIVGTIVLALRVAIPERIAGWLEFGVALMIIGLGVTAFKRALRSRSGVHIHKHDHGNLAHEHIHFHENGDDYAHSSSRSHSHALASIGLKPTLVGAMHGLAGSGALTLLVLAQIDSPALGLLYLAVFGLGSIIGMLLMSGLVGLPFVFSSRKLRGVHYNLQLLAGALSVAFGLWYAYVTGITTGLL